MLSHQRLIEPNLLSNEIIDFVAESKRFCSLPHAVAIGSDVLRLMRRRYDTKLFTDRVAHIKGLMPSCIHWDRCYREVLVLYIADLVIRN